MSLRHRRHWGSKAEQQAAIARIPTVDQMLAGVNRTLNALAPALAKFPKTSINDLVSVQPMTGPIHDIYRILSPSPEQAAASMRRHAAEDRITRREPSCYPEIKCRNVWQITLSEYEAMTTPEMAFAEAVYTHPDCDIVYYDDIGFLCGTAGALLIDTQDRKIIARHVWCRA